MSFDDTDLSEFKIQAVAGGQFDQIPPTMKEYGWHLKLLTVRKEQSQSGQDIVRFNAQIVADGRWDGHIGEFRLFLGGKWPDSAQAKFGSFAAACGIEGDVKKTTEFEGKEVIAEFKLSNDGKYSNISRWWKNTPDNTNRKTSQPLPTWTDAPNIQDGDVPF